MDDNPVNAKISAIEQGNDPPSFVANVNISSGENQIMCNLRQVNYSLDQTQNLRPTLEMLIENNQDSSKDDTDK